ncbi:hypothetical protein [Streptomyces sp. DSM 118878]
MRQLIVDGQGIPSWSQTTPASFLHVPRPAPPAVQLTALALAAHTEDGSGRAGIDDLARLCATAPSPWKISWTSSPAPGF